jgi:hypothetical protein
MKRKEAKRNLFWTFQGERSSNCRLHSLNAWFGKAKLTVSQFEDLAAEFDAKFAPGAGSETFTAIVDGGDGIRTCVVDWIVAREERYFCHLFVAGEATSEQQEGTLVAVFVFDNDHMFLEKLVDRRWYRIDSRCEQGPVQIKHPGRDVNSGRIFVWQHDKKAKTKK